MSVNGAPTRPNPPTISVAPGRMAATASAALRTFDRGGDVV